MAGGEESLSLTYKGALAGATPQWDWRLKMQLPDPPW
jgi:hypothetical protein